VREAEDRGWWRPSLSWAGRILLEGTEVEPAGVGPQPSPDPSLAIRALSAADLGRLRLAARTISPFDPADATTLLRHAADGGARVLGAVTGDVLVGIAVASLVENADEQLLAVGVAPSFRGAGLGRSLLRRLVEGRPNRSTMRAAVSVAERDVVEPLDVAVRIEIATRLLRGVGFDIVPVSPDVRRDDPWAIAAVLRAG
jgi:ribosomal protein S18 acetylase RimI-like enzyme